MAYRPTNLGLLVRLKPREAAGPIRAAFKATDNDDPGRVVDKAAKHLGVGPSTLKRWLEQLAEAGINIALPDKRPNYATPRKQAAG
jgi:hypothetical protein